MASNAAHPVFIFLPVSESDPDPDALVVDPVCGRAIAEGTVAGRLMHGGRNHYFCSLRCAEQFASEARERDSR